MLETARKAGVETSPPSSAKAPRAATLRSRKAGDSIVASSWRSIRVCKIEALKKSKANGTHCASSSMPPEAMHKTGITKAKMAEQRSKLSAAVSWDWK